MKKYIIPLILVFIGCSTKPPKWFFNPLNDTNEILYASSSGKTKEDAINNALNLAASKISIKINSIFISNKGYYKLNNHINTYSNVSKQITAQIKNFEFHNYKIIKIAKKDKYYVLIAIDRIKNANFLYQKAFYNYLKLKQYLNIKDKLEILKSYPKAIKQINKNISNLYIAKSLYNFEKIDVLIQKYIKLKNQLTDKLNNITFTIKNDYQNIIKNSLSDLNLNLSNKGIILNSSYSTKKYEINGYKIFIIKMNITMQDVKKINFTISCAGNSINNYDIAKNFAIIKCKEKLKEKIKEIIQIPY